MLDGYSADSDKDSLVSEPQYYGIAGCYLRKMIIDPGETIGASVLERFLLKII